MTAPLTTLGQPYDFPKPPLGNPSSTAVLNDFPTYVSPECEPLNRFYQVIEGSSEAFGRRDSVYNIFKRENFSLLFRRDTARDLAMPAPKLFTSDAYFESAMDDWFQEMRCYFAAAVLPRPVAGIFNLPELPKIFKKDEKMDPGRFRTFKATQWPLLPNNYLDMVDAILEKQPIKPDDMFKEQIPKRDVIYHKHHMTEAPQWMSQMAPCEPVPMMYNSFEEFIVAYKMWAHMTCKYMKIPLMKASEFTKIAAMDVVEQSTEPSRPTVRVTADQGAKMDLSWAPVLVYYPERIQAALGRIWNDMKKPKVVKGLPDANNRTVEVFGVVRKQFLQDMEVRGSYSGGTRPIDFYTGVRLRDVGIVTNMLAQATSYDLALVSRILDYDMSLLDFDSVMQFPVNRAKFASFVSLSVCQPAAMRWLFKKAQISRNYEFRVALLLLSMCRNDPNTQLAKMFWGQGNLDIFENGVRLLNMAAGKGISLIQPVRNMSQWRGFEVIERCYLLSVFLEVMSEYQNMKFYLDSIVWGRNLSRELCKYLAEQQNLTRLREAPEDSELYKALLMMLGTNSKQIHKLILGKDYLLWLNAAPSRPGLMSMICHTNVVFTAAQLLVQALAENVLGPLDQLVANLRTDCAILLTCVCKRMLDQFEKCGCRVTGNVILPLLEVVASSSRDCISAALVPLADVISSKSIISNLGASDFQPLLVRTVCKICQQIGCHTGDNLGFRQKLQTLIMLARDESCCFAMVQVPGFKICLIRHLTDKDTILSTRTWELFSNMAAYPPVASELFTSETKGLLAAIIDDKMDRWPLRRFLELIMNIWTRKDMAVTLKTVDILASRIGQLACLFKTRYVKYRRDEAMIELLERFYHSMIELDVGGNFLNQLADHMTEQRKARTRTQTMKSLRSQASIRPDMNSVLG